MTGLYEVTAHFATWHGNLASCRRRVRAASHDEALDLVGARVRTWKRYMGKLSMDCTFIQEIDQ